MNLSEAPPNTARITCLQCVTYAQIKRVVMWLSLSNNVETVTEETISETQEKSISIEWITVKDNFRYVTLSGTPRDKTLL